MKHWLFWHQPRSWRHRAFARAAMRLRHDVWQHAMRRSTRIMEKNIAATCALLSRTRTFTIKVPHSLNAETEKTERFLLAAFKQLEAQETPQSRAIKNAIFPPDEH